MKYEHLKIFLDKGINIIPLKLDKTPNIKAWSVYQKEMFTLTDDVKKFKNVGVICGSVSGSLEVIDIDLKYDLKGDLYERYQELVSFFDPELFGKLVICKTINDGLHLIYRCDEIGGNVKLAQRPAEGDEIKHGEKTKVLIETRGEGGYIVSYPSEGYEVIQGKLLNPPRITVDERELLMNCARALDEMPSEVIGDKVKVDWKSTGKPPWEDYNERTDLLDFMVKQGYSIVRQKGDTTFIKRPGKEVKSAYSGNYNSTYNVITIFSQNTQFEAGKAYNAFGAYAQTFCGGDIKQATKQLKELGYGDVPEDKYKKTDEEIEFIDETSFLSGDADDEMIDKFAKGELPLGLSTGYKTLDKYFRFKRKKFNIIGGHANLGKSTIIWYMALLSNILHKWKWVIYSSENEAWTIKKTLIEFLVGKSVDRMTTEERNKAKKYINDNFKIIELDDILSYREVLEYIQKVKKTTQIDACLIDPYNSLRFDYSDMDRKLSTYEFHYNVSNIFKKWAKVNDCTVYLNMHGVTEALRKVHSSGELKGHITPLNAADIEQGGMWVNRCDDMIIVHRYIHHEEFRTRTELHVKKVKEEFSGGRPTPHDSPCTLTMKNLYDFYSFYDENDETPLRDWFKINILGERNEIKEQYESYTPPSNNDFQDEINYSRGNTLRRSVIDDEPPF